MFSIMSLVGIQDHVRSVLQASGGLLKEDILFAKMINDGDEGSFLNKSSNQTGYCFSWTICT